MRKIIHIDCDCFYASVEERDDPRLRGRPLGVGGQASRRGVLCTANYPARRFGVRSAMPTSTALRLCPELIVVPTDMERYRKVARQIRQIFDRYTSLVEPLSLDEAYLDVTGTEDFNGSATRIAEAIRESVQREVGITVSAGVAPNKFLAKIASDWHKPDGLTVIPPARVDSFMPALPVSRIPGVGPVTARRLQQKGIHNCADLQAIDQTTLCAEFGSFGERLYHLARGEDARPVKISLERKSLSVERTFAQDLADAGQGHAALQGLKQKLQQRLCHLPAGVRIAGQFLKIKSDDFQLTTVDRQHDGPPEPGLFDALLQEAWARLDRPARLLGVGLRFHPSTAGGRQLALFD